MSSMGFAIATRKSAFLAGASLSALVWLIAQMHARNIVPHAPDDPEVFPFVLAYFFVSSFLFVVGVQSIAPKELKTRIPGVYFPTSRESLNFMFSLMRTVWVRMLLWFLGASSIGVALALVQWVTAR
jgi:hypothetical protein